MRTHLYKLTFILALGTGLALAQTEAPNTSQTPAAAPHVQTQNPPATADQSTIPQKQQNSSATPDQAQPAQNPKLPQSDAAPTTDLGGSVQSALQQEPTLKDSSISVNLKNGGIELSGTAPSGKEKKTAERIAKANANGKPVINHIKVTGPSHNSK
jgi:osmotically-inducible protein OsmY